VRDLLVERRHVRERVTRVAVFGGVYANDRALAAVLEDARARGAEAWCLGDLGGFGPRPDLAIARLRAAGVPCVRGNLDDTVGHDRADCACGYADPRDLYFSQRSFDYTVSWVSREHKAWLRALPEAIRLEAAGRRLLLCHGSPRRTNEFLWASTCSDDFLEWLCDRHEADVILCSHTGLHWARALPSGRHVINAGAIGRPANDGRPAAWYAEIELDGDVRVGFRAVEYDHEAMALEMEGEGLPPEFVETIRTGWWTTCLENLPAPERGRGRY
jgi:diadenosine tetraphosphatase ApaH/serine/threonine PP2A family protein phosphatase